MTETQPTADLRSIVAEAAQRLEGYDREFYERVWSTDLEVFRARLRAIQFADQQHVLDAGSGNGQWTLCLAQMNQRVTAVDISGPRLEATDHVLRSMGCDNYVVAQASIDALDFGDESFDAVFCYSALYFTDHARTLKEFHRVLRPGGKLYVCTNGPGWYIHNAIEPHNPSPHFDIRDMSIKAIANSIAYFSQGQYDSEAQLAVPRDVMGQHVGEAGFGNVRLADEGQLNPGGEQETRQFFAAEFFGLDGVYELMAEKPAKTER